MRVFLAGASGAIGRALLPVLIENGHTVTAMSRGIHNMNAVRREAIEIATVDGLNAGAVREAVAAAKPEVVIHQMTALAAVKNLKHFDEEFAQTNRLRTEGTRILIEAARLAGARTFIAQSYAGWPTLREGGRIKSESDPLDLHAPESMQESMRAIRDLEQMVSSLEDMTGMVLRYGSLYGPGSSTTPGGELWEMIRARKLPVTGDGQGIWSFLHVDDAASATAAAVEHATAGVYNIVDDDPVEAAIWIPELARQIGAKPPRHIPAWLARLAAGDAGVLMMTSARGASNEKAKRVLGWRPRYPSWKQGFRVLNALQNAA